MELISVPDKSDMDEETIGFKRFHIGIQHRASKFFFFFLNGRTVMVIFVLKANSIDPEISDFEHTLHAE